MVKNQSDTVILDLAETFGIEVKWYPSRIAVPRKFRGPFAHGCDPANRRLLLEEEPGEMYSDVAHPLHELVHIIVQPPWKRWTTQATPEEFVLFQFERSLARAVLEDWAYEQVITWQTETSLSVVGEYPGDLAMVDLPGYDRTHFWRRGFGLCRELGLLDARNRPTYRWPDWSRLEGRQKELAKFYRTFSKPRPADSVYRDE